MQQHLQAIVTVLSLVNPLICGAMFAQIEAGQTSATRLTDATKAALQQHIELKLEHFVTISILIVLEGMECPPNRPPADDSFS
jgi:hypothetical protein